MKKWCRKETKGMPLGHCCYKVKLDEDCKNCEHYGEIQYWEDKLVGMEIIRTESTGLSPCRTLILRDKERKEHTLNIGSTEILEVYLDGEEIAD